MPHLQGASEQRVTGDAVGGVSAGRGEEEEEEPSSQAGQQIVGTASHSG